VQLAAANSPILVQPQAQESSVLGALFNLKLGFFIKPPSAGQPFPATPEIPSPVHTGFEFEDAIINTYHAIEPWVRYGFELGAYAVGWIPWVGWLSPQIMIFYRFGERIVESLVVNSAEWLWGPLPFFEGLRNIARDSWDALVQLGIDEWNFWLPPLPFTARQEQAQPTAAVTLEPPTTRPAPLRDIVAALRLRLSGPHPVAQQTGDLQQKGDETVNEFAMVDVQRVAAAADPGNNLQSQAGPPRTDATPKNPGATKSNPSAPELTGTTPDITSAPLTPLENPKPLGTKSKLTAETSNPSPRRSKESVVASNSLARATNDRVGTLNAPKHRFNGTNKHRMTGEDSHVDR
jgi:hypothetical protein